MGFIDGTFVYTARPIHGQESLYNGWKRGHGLKFQGLSFPDGIIGSFHGPVPGRRHDEFLVLQSRIRESIRFYQVEYDMNIKIYGDQGYHQDDVILCPLALQSEGSTEWNKLMSSLRVSVEWAFRDLKNIWQTLRMKLYLRNLQTPVGLMCIVCCLLCNCKTCLYGNTISSYFDCPPMSLEDYLSVIA